jgi:hypothetical protein
MSMQEKKQMKFERKNPIFDEKDVISSPFVMNQKEQHTIRQMSSCYITKPSTFDQKEDSNMLYETTPQQYFNRRSVADNQGFASPYDFPKRQLPGNGGNRPMTSSFSMNPVSSSSPMKFNETKRFEEPQRKIEQNMLSPSISASNYLKQSLNSPCCISARSTVMKLLKTLNAKSSDIDKLKAVKQLLIEFRDFENSQKDKIITMVDKMITQKNFGESTFGVSLYMKFEFLKF